VRDAIQWRIGGGAPPSPDSFAIAARSAARRLLADDRADPVECAQTLGATLRAARRLTRSRLWSRLMTISPTAFVQATRSPAAPEAIVRDRRRRVHLITVAVLASPLDAARRATRTAAGVTLPARDRLTPATIHVFSLTTGRRHVFVRDVQPAALRTSRVA
jgi:hypothetical protein